MGQVANLSYKARTRWWNCTSSKRQRQRTVSHKARTRPAGGGDLQINARVIYQNLLILFAGVFPITGGRQSIGHQGA